jgi:probable phosphoglycerate mutase
MDEDGSGSPLAERGLREAALVARRLAERKGVLAVYTSPLLRAQQTADVIGQELGLPPIVRDGLRETGLGKTGGLTEQEVIGMFPEEWARSKGDLPQFWEKIRDSAGVEDGAVFLQRVMAAMKDIVAFHPQDAVVVVAHSGVHGVSVAQLVDGDVKESFKYDSFGNCAVTEIKVADGRGEIVMLNNQDHLAGLTQSE